MVRWLELNQLNMLLPAASDILERTMTVINNKI